jgi:hypothetical protein
MTFIRELFTKRTGKSHRSFPHRRNEDGSFDSICPGCYQTVATEANEAELSRFEREHVCNPIERNHFDELRSQQPHRSFLKT